MKGSTMKITAPMTWEKMLTAHHQPMEALGEIFY